MEIKVPFLKTPLGAGDLVKAATTAAGVKPCGGCQKRAEALNRGLTFTPLRNDWDVLPATPEGWQKEMTHETESGRVEFYSKPADGYIMIWQVVGEKYQQSHGFCCSLSLRTRAVMKWAELCR